MFVFRKVVPKPLRESLGKTEIKRSLGTKDPRVARQRFAEVAAEVERLLEAHSKPPITLTNRQIAALSGVLYRQTVDMLADEPGTSAIWAHAERIDQEGRESGNLERWYGPTVDELLMKEGLRVDANSRERLLLAASDALRQAFKQLKRNAEGDYRPDPDAERFPAYERPARSRKSPSAGVTLDDVLERWWKEASAAGYSPKTYEAYAGVISRFKRHLGHSDPTRVTAEDVVAYKDARLSEINPRTQKPVSPKTVKDTDLAGLKTLFGWAKGNRITDANPAEGISVKVGKRSLTRPKGFTNEEARALLTAAWGLKKGREKEKTYLAKRWVPWICAYTGARVGEIVQLRKQDLVKENGYWVLTITPEAGTTKSKNLRQVVIHQHLVELGLPDFVTNAGDGYLFVDPDPKKDPAGRLKSIANRVREFVREHITDDRVQPNHGWRHRFKTVWREVGLDSRVSNAIQDHASGTVGDDYGDVTMIAQRNALAKFPRQA